MTIPFEEIKTAFETAAFAIITMREELEAMKLKYGTESGFVKKMEQRIAIFERLHEVTSESITHYRDLIHRMSINYRTMEMILSAPETITGHWEKNPNLTPEQRQKLTSIDAVINNIERRMFE